HRAADVGVGLVLLLREPGEQPRQAGRQAPPQLGAVAPHPAELHLGVPRRAGRARDVAQLALQLLRYGVAQLRAKAAQHRAQSPPLRSSRNGPFEPASSAHTSWLKSGSCPTIATVLRAACPVSQPMTRSIPAPGASSPTRSTR